MLSKAVSLVNKLERKAFNSIFSPLVLVFEVRHMLTIEKIHSRDTLQYLLGSLCSGAESSCLSFDNASTGFSRGDRGRALFTLALRCLGPVKRLFPASF